MSNFFAVGLPEFHEACLLGINPAVSLLVMACGTGRDNQTTSWSANAIQKHCGISAKRAKLAIDALIAAGIVQEVSGTRNRPSYKLRISEDQIWLPKSLIMPLSSEIPPVARIRQTQDVLLLNLLISLYFFQDLATDNGLSRIIYYRQYQKEEKYWEHGQYIFLGFEPANICTDCGYGIMHPHFVEAPRTDQQAEEKEVQDFFRRMETLCDLGLLEEAACLFESDDSEAEILFPVDGPTEEEKQVLMSMEDAVELVLPEWHARNNPYKYMVPVYRHQKKAEMFGIFRLRHRPHTSMTSAWAARLQTQINDALRFFKKITR